MNPFRAADWNIPVKTVKDLAENPFDGNLVHYKEWHDAMRDHLLSANQGYGRLMYELERLKTPITMAEIQRNPWAIQGLNLDLLWATRQL